jgi:hypothetical protein
VVEIFAAAIFTIDVQDVEEFWELINLVKYYNIY